MGQGTQLWGRASVSSSYRDRHGMPWMGEGSHTEGHETYLDTNLPT